MIPLIIRSQRGCNDWKELYYFYFKGTFSLSFYAFRCTGAEICQSGPRDLEGEVIIPVPLCGQRGSPERTGTVSTDVPNPKSLDLHVSPRRHLTPPLLPSEALHGGRLLLQRAAAGRRIHPLPVLAPRIPFVSGIQTVPRPSRGPLHTVPTAQEYLGSGEHV